MSKLGRRLDRGPLGTGRDRNPDIAPTERIESIRCRIDLRGASPEIIVSDAEEARSRTQGLAVARYLGVSMGYHYFAVSDGAGKNLVDCLQGVVEHVQFADEAATSLTIPLEVTPLGVNAAAE